MHQQWNRSGARIPLVLCAAFIVAASACGHANAVSPSTIAANAAKYDRQDVTVTGTVKNPTAHQFRRGTATTYQLCDNSCVSVLQFGAANVSDGDTQTVTGRFFHAFGRRRFHMQDVVIVGERMRR